MVSFIRLSYALAPPPTRPILSCLCPICAHRWSFLLFSSFSSSLCLGPFIRTLLSHSARPRGAVCSTHSDRLMLAQARNLHGSCPNVETPPWFRSAYLTILSFSLKLSSLVIIIYNPDLILKPRSFQISHPLTALRRAHRKCRTESCKSFRIFIAWALWIYQRMASISCHNLRHYQYTLDAFTAVLFLSRSLHTPLYKKRLARKSSWIIYPGLYVYISSHSRRERFWGTRDWDSSVQDNQLVLQDFPCHTTEET